MRMMRTLRMQQNGTHREQGPDRNARRRYKWRCGRIDGPEWVRPPDVLTKSSNVQGPGNVNPTGVLYNASIHETTGNAPFEMMLVDSAFNTNPGNATTTSKYVEELAAHFRNAFAAARKHSAEQQTRQRYYYDQTTGNSHYEDQEAVWLYCAATKSKPNRKVVILWTALRTLRQNDNEDKKQVRHDDQALNISSATDVLTKTMEVTARLQNHRQHRGHGGIEDRQPGTTATSYTEVS
ncbi:hypothetical protein T11_3877 [Trichinella zimbabwensis]|uniref:Uncharacterized protein n=1 Tax=Trichinella zimbabwensis TaxID=268475 RepID=A0A0V1HJ10_9BILA|nr:hypothetical protein T11_3877 [Trichinella zimbabwensis]